MRRSRAVLSAVALAAAVGPGAGAAAPSAATRTSRRVADGARVVRRRVPGDPGPARGARQARAGRSASASSSPPRSTRTTPRSPRASCVTKALFTGLVHVRAERRGLRRGRLGVDAERRLHAVDVHPQAGHHVLQRRAGRRRGVQARLGAHRGPRLRLRRRPTTSTRSRASPRCRTAAPPTLSGVDATDPNTLTVTLSTPDCEFELRTAAPGAEPGADAWPARRTTRPTTTSRSATARSGWTAPWQHDRASGWCATTPTGRAPRRTSTPSSSRSRPADAGAQTEYNGFLNGQFDWARMPTPLLAQARAANEPKGQWISKKTHRHQLPAGRRHTQRR